MIKFHTSFKAFGFKSAGNTTEAGGLTHEVYDLFKVGTGFDAGPPPVFSFWLNDFLASDRFTVFLHFVLTWEGVRYALLKAFFFL